MPIDESGSVTPLDVTEEDKQYAILHYGEEHETAQIYELGTKLASELHCRERQLREALFTLSATQRTANRHMDHIGAISATLDVPVGMNAVQAAIELRGKLSTTQREREELLDKCEHLKQEAIRNAQEMRTQKTIVREIYQLFTGATGEPGDWNGAEPARKVMAELSASQARVAELEKALKKRDFAYEWISVIDALPPENKNVAILVEDANVAIHDWTTAGYYHSSSSGWWHGTPGDYRSCNDQRWTVTHWAYLPNNPTTQD